MNERTEFKKKKWFLFRTCRSFLALWMLLWMFFGNSAALQISATGVLPKEGDKAAVVALGGTPFGVRFNTAGAIVYRVIEGSAAERAGLLSGDLILKVNGQELSSASEFGEELERTRGKKTVLQVERGGKKVRLSFRYDEDEQSFGAFLRDSLAGIGTLSFYDPRTLKFAGLGHGICDPESGAMLPFKSGSISKVRLTGVMKGEKGAPGQLRGVFYPGSIGKVEKNCKEGIYGVLDAPLEECTLIEIAHAEEVCEGPAVLYCTIEGFRREQYDIMIEKIYCESSQSKDYLIRVTDPALLERTGGIVQGMSGSPILQNGKLIGAVTHVLVNDPQRGYAISGEKMYENLS